MKKKNFAIILIAVLFVFLGTSCSQKGLYIGGGPATYAKTEADIFRLKKKPRSSNFNGQLSSHKERNGYKKYK